MLKTDNVQVAVWVAAAIIAFEESNKTDGDVFVRQVDIQREASKYCTNDVAAARIGQWYNGDHSNNTYNFLRSKGPLRRLTKCGEFNGVAEVPEELKLFYDEIVILNNEIGMNLKDLLSWTEKKYTITSMIDSPLCADKLDNNMEIDLEVSDDYLKRIDLIVNQSWDILISQFIGGRLILTKEAPFQHHFASIIKSIGNQHCYKRSEQFHVDLETKDIGKHGKSTYIDIVLEMYNEADLVIKSAIELKFKKKSQGADDFARIDSYVDIELLEFLKNKGYHQNYFFMITDSSIYTRSSRSGTTADTFSMREGYSVPVDSIVAQPLCKGKQDVYVEFKEEHIFNWIKRSDLYFLKMKV